VDLVLDKQPLLSNNLSSSGRDSRTSRTGYLSSFLVSLFFLHAFRFQTVSPSPLRKLEEEEESFDMRIVRVGGGVCACDAVPCRKHGHSCGQVEIAVVVFAATLRMS